MDWNGQEKFSLSCELWVGTNDFSCPFQSTDNFPEWKLALRRESSDGKLVCPIDILYTLDSASNYSAIQNLKP